MKKHKAVKFCAFFTDNIYVIYEEYMRSDLWRTKREQRLIIDRHECRTCGCKERLEVHHKPDSYAKLPNESVEDDLTTLCVWCHDLITNKIRKGRYEKKPVTLQEHQNNLVSTLRRTDNGRMENVKIQAHRSIPRNFT